LSEGYQKLCTCPFSFNYQIFAFPAKIADSNGELPGDLLYYF